MRTKSIIAAFLISQRPSRTGPVRTKLFVVFALVWTSAISNLGAASEDCPTAAEGRY
jgi:hypothetical protein